MKIKDSYVAILSKKTFPDKSIATKKAESKGFNTTELVESKNAYRFKQADESSFKQESFRVQDLSVGFSVVYGVKL